MTGAAAAILTQLCARYPIGYEPEIRWKALRVTAGQANTREGWIGLSAFLLTDRQRLEDTLKHEYAHLLAVARHGPKAAGHGPEWKQAMLDLGLEPVVHHCYPVKRNAFRQEVAYVCTRCGSRIVRKRRLPRRRTYVHKGCGGVVRFAQAIRLTQSVVTA